MKWAVPEMWKGATVAILASGPSMSQGVAYEVCAAGVPTIVVNTTFRLAPWADMLYACDSLWWSYHQDALKFAGLKVSTSPEFDKSLLALKISGVSGFDENPECLRSGGNSGYQAMHIAIHAGAKRILLCGFDMRRVEAEHRWHGQHPVALRNPGEGIFETWLPKFATLLPALEARDVEVINCTQDSALKLWPYAPFEKAVCP